VKNRTFSWDRTCRQQGRKQGFPGWFYELVFTMKIVRCTFAFLLAGALFARAGDQTLALPELIQGAEEVGRGESR
jgi:hypothetical protein